MINLTSPVTGQAITGLTSPTYTLVQDGALPPGVSIGWYVSALGGTQTGVNAHSIANPFTISWKNPKSLVSPGSVDVTGVYRAPTRRNHYEMLIRKGAAPISGQSPRTNFVKTTFDIEAGCETTSQNELAAALSLAIGALTQIRDGILTTLVTGSP